MAAAKSLLRRIAGCSSDEAMRLAVDAIAVQRVSPEAQHRMKAFLQKQSPKSRL
jgi:hypothetical protein